jgi:hypothetical protein
MARIATAVVGGPPRVDLLPRSELDRREREKLSAIWVRIGLLAVLLAVLLIGGAMAFNLWAQQNLAAEQARSSQLVQQIGALSDVSGALATETELQNFRGEAMGSDLAWTAILDKVRSPLLPDNAVLGFDLTPGVAPAPATADAKKDEEAAKKAVGLTGTLTIESPTAVDLGPYVRSLRGVPGVLAADANAVVTSQAAPGRYTYTVDITFDQTVYSDRFVKEASK